MSKKFKAYNFFSMQILFQDRTRMSELLDVVNYVENMGGDISDITVQVIQDEVGNNRSINDIFEEIPYNMYGKYKN